MSQGELLYLNAKKYLANASKETEAKRAFLSVPKKSLNH